MDAKGNLADKGLDTTMASLPLSLEFTQAATRLACGHRRGRSWSTSAANSTIID
jgi:hypothetical protein